MIYKLTRHSPRGQTYYLKIMTFMHTLGYKITEKLRNTQTFP